MTEYIEGRSLPQSLRSDISIEEVLDISIQLVSALVAAHRLSIVHRDLKLESIIREEDYVVKVPGIGLAKLSHSGESLLNRCNLLTL